MINSVQVKFKMNIKELLEVAKSLGLKKYSRLPKVELQKLILESLPNNEPKKPKGKKVVSQGQSLFAESDKAIEEFKKSGGKITICTPQKNPKVVPETPRAAMNNYDRKSPKKVAKKKVKKLREKTTTKDRDDVDGITLLSLCEEAGVTTVKARKKLRAMGIKKPGKQWVWSKERDTLEIKEILSSLP